MIPLRDANPTSTTPIVTFVLIGLNVLIFLYEMLLSDGGFALFVYTMGMVPERVAMFPASPDVSLFDAYFPFLSSMFMHGGFWHIIGNMWFLWIFGDNIEDYLGRGKFIAFYLLCGLGAGLTHLAFNWGSRVPVIGASGAVAGVLGAYMLLYPRAKVLTLIPIFFYFFTVELPAGLILVYWFVIQFFSGAVSLGGADGSGTAWWAHVGGFVLGMALIKLFPRKPAPGSFSNRVVN